MATTEEKPAPAVKEDKKGFESNIHFEDAASPIPVLQGELERSFSWVGALGLGATYDGPFHLEIILEKLINIVYRILGLDMQQLSLKLLAMAVL